MRTNSPRSRVLAVCAVVVLGVVVVVLSLALTVGPRNNEGPYTEMISLGGMAVGGALVGMGLSLIWEPNPLQRPWTMIVMGLMFLGLPHCFMVIAVWGYIILSSSLARGLPH